MEHLMEPIRLYAIISLISLPTVMFGGYALLRLLNRGDGLEPFQHTYFRAGHAHAGVLLVLSLVYYDYLDRTTFSDEAKWLAGGLLVAGILAQSGGFFLHMANGKPGSGSIGTRVTAVGAVFLAIAVAMLAVGWIVEYPD
jgi:hypothetical protein